MLLTVARADFADPRLSAFLQAHLDDLAPTAPAESRHALDLAALQASGVRLWVAAGDDEIAGTVALAALEPGPRGAEEHADRAAAARPRGRGPAARPRPA